MELNAAHSHISRELLLLVHSLRGRVSILFRSGVLVGVAQHVEIVLEDVDDFVGLEGLFDSVSHLVHELFQFGVELVVLIDGCLHALHEVIGVIQRRGVDTTLEVSLSLQLLDLVTGLQADFKDSPSLVRTLVLFVVGSQVVGRVSGVLRHCLEIQGEFLARLSNTHLEERPNTKGVNF